MKQIENADMILKYCSALGSPVRVDIVKLLQKHRKMNMDMIAKELFLTNGAITSHIKRLSECGIIKIVTSAGLRGSQKECMLDIDKILINISDSVGEDLQSYEFDIDVGLYSDYRVLPTCGLVTDTAIIGEMDEVKYFAYPERLNAQLIWLTEGYLEYRLPNPLKKNEQLADLQISFEISSEAPGFTAHYPSDIYFYINDINLGFWESPGEFNDRPGILTPDWWFRNLGQYGRLKMLTVNDTGTFIDGLPLSNYTISKLKIVHESSITFRICVPPTAKNRGGFNLFGKKFGDYSQGIKVRMLVK